MNKYTHSFLKNVVLKFDKDECLTWPYFRNKAGYGRISIKHNGKRIKTAVHRLVCEMINGKAPSDKHHAAHNCGNGFNGCCNPKHLEWKTAKANIADKMVHGTQNMGENHPSSKLTSNDVREIKFLSQWASYSQLGKMFGVSRVAIRCIVSGKTWKIHS